MASQPGVKGGIVEAIEYIVTVALTGHKERLKMYLEYLEGESPSVIAFKYNVSKNVVRGIIQRIHEKIRMYPTAGKRVLKYVVRSAMRSIDPVYTCDGEKCICNICGATVPNNYHVKRAHIESNHQAVIADETVKMVTKVRKRLLLE